MSFLQEMKQSFVEIFENGDPTLRTWFLVNSYYLPFVCSFAYVMFVKKIGPHLMKERKPFDLRAVMILYNFSLVFIYGCCLTMLAYLFLTTNAYTKLCSEVKVTDADWVYTATYIAWILYILKFFEFADTIFFVLRKKDRLITNLHVIHHATLPIIGWMLFRTETSGFQFIPGTLNSFIHMIMYTYYGLSAFGPEVQKYLWWKEYLTQLQILQFVLIILFVLIIIPLFGCTTSRQGIYMDIFFGGLFLVLFLNFYFKTYTRSAERDSNSKSKAHMSNGYVSATNGKSTSNGKSSSNRKSAFQNGKVPAVNEKSSDEEENGQNRNYGQFLQEHPLHGDLRQR